MIIKPRKVNLYLKPDKLQISALITGLTPGMVDEKIRDGWWSDESLDDATTLNPQPIDRYWNWNQLEIERNGVVLPSEKIGVVAGDDELVEGAMMISREPIECVEASGKQALFVELLFTAPRNRPRLRKDKSEFLLGVGIKMLSWGVWFSRELGYEGRLMLDGSEEFIPWYHNRGLRELDLAPIIFEGQLYKPMELPLEAANVLLNSKWEA